MEHLKLFWILVFLLFTVTGCGDVNLKQIGNDTIKNLQPVIDNVKNIDINKDKLNETYINVAISLSSEVKDFYQVNLSSWESYESAKLFIDNTNDIILIINENFPTNFETIDVKYKEFENIAHFVQKYSPAIGPYNELIENSKKVSPDNHNSVNDFYVSAFSLSTSIFLIQSNTLHQSVFISLGHLNKHLHLYEIKNVCGNQCFGVLSKKIYWFLKREAINFSTGIAEWLGEYYKGE